MKNLFADEKELAWAKSHYAGLLPATRTIRPTVFRDGTTSRFGTARSRYGISLSGPTERRRPGPGRRDPVLLGRRGRRRAVGLRLAFPIGRDLTALSVGRGRQSTKASTARPASTSRRMSGVSPVKDWNPGGAPQYDLARCAVIFKVAAVFLHSTPWVDGSGDVLLLNEDPMKMCSCAGKVALELPQRLARRASARTGPQRQAGIADRAPEGLGLGGPLRRRGEVFCLSGNMGKAFFHDHRRSCTWAACFAIAARPRFAARPPTSAACRSPDHAARRVVRRRVFPQPPDNKVYIGSGQARGRRLPERSHGLGEHPPVAAGRSDFGQDQYAAAEKLLGAGSRRRTKGTRSSPCGCCGRPAKELPAAGQFDWRHETSAAWQFDKKHAAEAAWTYDQQNLYLCFRNVLDDTPMVNGGKQVSNCSRPAMRSSSSCARAEPRRTRDRRGGFAAAAERV